MDRGEDPFEAIAIDMMGLAEEIDALIQDADEDTDITYLVDTKYMLLDRAAIFWPPGKPHDGYPKGSAQVFNLESERAKRGR